MRLPRSILPRTIMISRNLIFACALGCLSVAKAQDVQEPRRPIPTNAHYSADEQGWACDRGFTQVGGRCLQDSDVASSAGAFEIFDGQWRCRAGYHRAGKFCVPGIAPEHATYVGEGDHWECDWGFQKSGSQCQEVKPPPHGYIEASGHDWVCYPGFTRVSDHCAPAAPAPKSDATTPPS
jgi:hypothetical protein